ncbi:MAG: TatD family hydrolase [Spirochaetaceae bacterium]|jgi:TatD DNase family protein|nr:TatD family hydrolase [Spirochaetaceae bacterium]
MASDAHAHPFYLSKVCPGAEAERRALNIICAASAWNGEDFLYNENAAGNFPMALCFAVHPQLGAARESQNEIQKSLPLLYQLSGEKRIDAVGETGFDLFNEEFRASENIQDELFEHHLFISEKYGLPVVLHLRRAMHKIFSHTRRLKNVPAVVFHSYSGTADEAESLLRRGINAYFSFGTAILLNHKTAMKACAAIDAERLLFETDAPYQSPRGRRFSSYADIIDVINKAAELRRGADKDRAADELERISDENFYKVYKKRLK